jgi:SAM-dependent methyltransferase
VIQFDKYELNGAYHWQECDPRSRNYNPPLAARYEIVQKHLATVQNAKRVLDVGCGDAFLMAAIHERCETIVGIDPEPRAVELATKLLAGYKNCRVFQGDCYHIPFENASFDVVVLTDVIEHLAQPQEALMEIRRVLTPEGVLILTTPKYRPDRKWDQRHEKEYTVEELRELLSKVFTHVQMTFFWPTHWSNFYSTRVGWWICKYVARWGWNPFLQESVDQPYAFGQLMSVCDGLQD